MKVLSGQAMIPTLGSRFKFALLHFGLFAQCLFGQMPNVVVQATGNEGYPAKLIIPTLPQPMVLQRSTHLDNWRDCLALPSSTDEMEMLDPSPSENPAMFYRLRPLLGQPSIWFNTAREDPLLARLTSGDDLEISFYGTRDQNGYPSAVQNISYNVGNHLHLLTFGEDPEPPTTNDVVATTASQNIALTGFVIVEAGSGCGPPNALPKIYYTSVEPSFTDKYIERTVDAIPISQEGVPTGQIWYRYSVPIYVPGPCPDESEGYFQAAKDALLAALRSAVTGPGAALTALTLTGAAVGAFPATVTLGTLLTAEALIANMIGVTLTALAVEDAVLKTIPLESCDYSVEEEFIASYVRIEAVIPTGEDHNLYSSGMQVIQPWNFVPSDGPVLIIDADDWCSPVINTLPDYVLPSYLATEAELFDGSGTQYKDEDEIRPTSFGSKTSVASEIVKPIGASGAKASIGVSYRSIIMRGDSTVLSSELDSQAVARCDTGLYFKIDPLHDFGDGASIDVLFETSSNAGGVGGSLTRAGQSQTFVRLGGNESTIVQLTIGSIYRMELNYIHSIIGRGGEYGEGILTLSILGNSNNW